MKIQSLVHKETTTILCNASIEFNIHGVAEVDKEVGKEILEKFPTVIFEEGKVVVKEEKKKGKEEKVAEDKSEELLAKIEVLEKENKSLKEVLDEVSKSGEGGVKSELDKDSLSIFYDIAVKKKKDLEEDCESVNLPKEEWDKLNHKDLVFYLAEKILKK